MQRMKERHLPGTPTPCRRDVCVYNVEGVCDDPRTNRGNGDADCHRVNVRDLLQEFEEERS